MKNENARRVFWGGVMLAGLVASMAAFASLADDMPEYCSPSIGCVDQFDGKNIYAPDSANLTAQERDDMVNCHIQVAGALAGLASRSWAGVL